MATTRQLNGKPYPMAGSPRARTSLSKGSTRKSWKLLIRFTLAVPHVISRSALDQFPVPRPEVRRHLIVHFRYWSRVAAITKAIVAYSARAP